MLTKIIRRLLVAVTVSSVGFASLAGSAYAISYNYASHPNVPQVQENVVKNTNIKLDVQGSSANRKITVSWQALANVNFDYYKVVFKKGFYTSFSNISVQKAFVTNNSYTLVGLDVDDWWSFRVVPVKLYNGNYVEVTNRSDMLNVQVNGGGSEESVILARPIVITPSRWGVLTNLPRKAFLSWEQVAGAQYYEIELACRGCGVNNGWTTPTLHVSNTNNFTTPALDGDNSFRFRVRAVGNGNMVSKWSHYRNFAYNTSGAAITPQPIVIKQIKFDIIAPEISWSRFHGDYDGYALILKKGEFSESALFDLTPIYLESSRHIRDFIGLDENTTYSVVVVPYRNENGNKVLLKAYSSNVLHFTTAVKS